ncbi:hypothetical protein M8818_001439 [Zalaria obscura]|uniref:Uncharacterized protein n=1 Tax=Zalaria obscura TaxID=2024903 RepID=A0ACC3SK72_9PEZI
MGVAGFKGVGERCSPGPELVDGGRTDVVMITPSAWLQDAGEETFAELVSEGVELIRTGWKREVNIPERSARRGVPGGLDALNCH